MERLYALRIALTRRYATLFARVHHNLLTPEEAREREAEIASLEDEIRTQRLLNGGHDGRPLESGLRS